MRLGCLTFAEDSQNVIDEIFGEHEAVKGAGAVTQPIELDKGNVNLQVCAWIGGRIFSLIHKPSGQEWLEGRLESGRYEEYSTAEYRSPGCTEAYTVLKYVISYLLPIFYLFLNLYVNISSARTCNEAFRFSFQT